jgi:putative intracellular protease/amidase
LFFQIEYSTHTATKPTTPSAPNDLTISVTPPITSVAGKNGIAAPLNNTSRTIAKAKTLTIVSARAPAQFLIVAKISMELIRLLN